ncbi:uncharacterized protein MELLADRAFT_106607 [Melampsora larici-populina 98AG31]|uniref:Uncharacterized protein n=1 Tax=Melampsora larici-populina (strain 98AG31 / pathotype 3-4-7) TaxID=747676 RepID=F4RM21_MELLP|nr:uncharacterized protein MELLADRAFT_106607 [Melampsora larici-populina 98AG31]EGG06663.1 hypothetical protein MELLADRAFT_106607 [Melampsora larici-populina 98AG31]
MNSKKPSHLTLYIPGPMKMERAQDLGSQTTSDFDHRSPTSRVSASVILTLDFLLISVLCLTFSNSSHIFNSTSLSTITSERNGCQAYENLTPWSSQSQYWLMWYAWFKMASGVIILNRGLPTRQGWIKVSSTNYLIFSIFISLLGFVALQVNRLLPSALNNQEGFLIQLTETFLCSIISLFFLAIPGFCAYWALSGILHEICRLSVCCFGSSKSYDDQDLEVCSEPYDQLPAYYV